MKKILLMIITAAVILASLWSCSEKTEAKATTEEKSDPSVFDDYENYDYDGYIKLGKYKGIEYEKHTVEYKDEYLQSRIGQLLKDNAKLVEANGEAAEGDTATIEYVGKMDGEVFEGGSTREPVDIVLGSSGYIDGFDDGVIGMKPGDTKDLELVFPDPYYTKKEYSGKPVVFTVTLVGLKREEVPEYNDEFIAGISTEYKTVDEYNEYLKKEIIDELTEKASVDDVTDIWQTVFNNATIYSCPQAEVERYFEKFKSVYEQKAAAMGGTLDDIIAANGLDENEFYSDLRSQAEDRVKTELVLYSIAKAEKIKLGEDEYNDWIETYIAENEPELTREQFDEKYSGSDVRASMISDKVIRFITDSAKPSESAEAQKTDEVKNTAENKTAE